MTPRAFYPAYLKARTRFKKRKFSIMSHLQAFRVADLPQNRSTPFEICPDAAALGALAKELDLLDLRKLRFQGEIQAKGKRDWLLKARLGATVVQPCVVTLEPVTTRIDTQVQRLFLAEISLPEEAEVEMPEDDSVEQLGAEIDVATIMAESLALHLPQYPRKDGAELGEAVFTEPGQTPMRDEDTRPFAGLAALKDALDRDK